MSHYDVLGVEPTATGTEIHQRYRERAQVLHPDHGGDTAAFRRLNEAFRVLSDPERRRAYDAALASPRRSGAGPTPGPVKPPGEPEVVVDDIPAWARDRWVTVEVDLTPKSWWTEWNEQAARRQARDWEMTVWSMCGVVVGAAVGLLTDAPAVVAGVFAITAGMFGPPLRRLIRTGRR